MQSHFLVWRNLSAHPLRSFLTALAITLGVGMVLAAAIVGQAANDSAADLAAASTRFDLEVTARDGRALSDEVLEQIRALPQVLTAALQPSASSISIRLREGTDIHWARDSIAQTLGADYVVAQAVNPGGVQFSVRVLQALLAFVGLIILFAAVYVIANAFAMSLTARQKEIGALRALGTTRRQILLIVLMEAGVLGAAGAAAGMLVGPALAWLVLWVQGFTEYFTLPGWALIVAPLVGLLAALVAALQPAFRASRLSPLEILRSTSHTTIYPARQTFLRLALFIIAVLALILFSFIARPDFITGALIILPALGLVLGLAVWTLPAFIAPLANAAQPLLGRWLGAAGRLAADNLRRHPARAAVTAGALTAGLTMMIATSGLITAMLKGGLQVFGTLIIEDRIILPIFTDVMRLDNAMAHFTGAPPLPAPLRAELQALAATGDIELERIAILPIPDTLSTLPNYPGLFLDPEPFLKHGGFEFFEGDPDQALALFQRGRAVLIQPMVAARLNLHVGDTVALETSQGLVDFTVAGIGGIGWNMPAFSYADGRTYFNAGEPPFYGVFVAEGRDKDAVLERVDHLAADYDGLQSLSLVKSLDVLFEMLDNLILLVNALLLLAVIVAALGVVNTMLANVSERQREIALLRAIGATQRQVRRAVLAEAALLGIFAALAAAAFSALLFVVYVIVFLPNGPASLGVRITFAEFLPIMGPGFRDMGLMALAALFFAPALAALAAYWPARQAAALDVAEATRSEELSLRPAATRREEGEDVEERALPRSLPLLLAQRSIEQQRTRVTLSVVAITLGATMTVAGDVLAKSIIGVVTRTEDLRAVGEGLWSQLDPMFKGIGAGIMLAAGFLIFNTFAMSITQRRQQIGALRSLGMTRGQVLRMVLAEALIIGGVGTLLGLVLGPFLGQGIIAFMRSLDNPILNAFAPSQPSSFSFVLAAVMGLGITVLASLVPARQAMRLSPLVALKAPDLPGVERNPNRLGLAGLAFCLLLTAYLIFSPPALWLQPPFDSIGAVIAATLWIVGLALTLPALVGVMGTSLRPWLTRLWGATGRLMADNLQRGRGRVLLTVITLAVSLTMIGALTGFIQFYLFEFFGPKLDALKQEGAWVASTMELEGGLAGYADMESLRMSPEAVAAMRTTAGERANVIPFGFVIVPELSFMGDTYFSFIINPQALREAGSLFITFKHGDWDTALPILERGCGVLMTPAIAARNHVSAVGDTFTVTSRYGPVQCAVAGIGSTFVGATIISEAAQDSFDKGDPFTLFIQSRPGVNSAQLEADLQKTADQYGVHMLRMSRYTEIMLSVFDNVPTLFNAFLLMAVLAAALGVVNTTLLSVTERRREFGQLRALGATRAQVRAIVVGEAALMGFLGGLVGLVASVGLTVIFATVYGGSSVGVENYQPWAAAFRTLPKVWPTGLVGVLASPLICALAAYLPANAVLRGAAIETLKPEQPQPITRRQIAGLLSRGSLQTRFVLGTGVLLAVVLGALLAVVTSHAGNYLEARTRDGLAAMLTWNATLVEMSLPADADNLTLSNLQSQSQFGAEGMLRFKSLLDDMSANGLVDMAIADRDNVVLFSLDTRDIGTTLPPLDSTEKTVVRSERAEDDTPQLAAAAPIQNSDGALVGSLRMTMRLEELRAFMNRLRSALWSFGTAILVVGLAVSWALSRPFVGAARQLAKRAGRVARGDYSPMERPSARRWPGSNLSIRTRLTIALVLLVAVMVGVLGVAVIPLERRQVERTLRDGMLTAAEFIGEAFSEMLGSQTSEISQTSEVFNLSQWMTTMPNLNLARLREVSEQARSDDIAYLAVVNNDGVILLADDVALMGESAPVSEETRVEDGQWKGEVIWVAATPLRRGREGEQIGTLRLGVRRKSMETFLDESRNLFWLTGMIAVLAGVLLAQGVGGAVTAPVQELAAGARRVARGDLAVRFRSDTRDELAQLAGAFNEMVIGLREREQLRDLFGRYVSREVSEAVLSGRVSLKGERKTITVLYVDMRGSTAFAESHAPEEVMEALNQYFEVVILATETHGGIVNRFVGDEAVCVFGAPTDQPDHAAQAVQAALAMRAGLAYLNQKRAALGLPTLRFGIGLNTGEVVAGATGSEERQEYTVIGDAMNLGARIQELSKTFPEHGILLGESTLAALGACAEDYEFADLGAVEIRGKSKAVRVYGVVERRR